MLRTNVTLLTDCAIAEFDAGDTLEFPSCSLARTFSQPLPLAKSGAFRNGLNFRQIAYDFETHSEAIDNGKESNENRERSANDRLFPFRNS